MQECNVRTLLTETYMNICLDFAFLCNSQFVHGRCQSAKYHITDFLCIEPIFYKIVSLHAVQMDVKYKISVADVGSVSMRASSSRIGQV